jgi:hypothetical protein
MEEAQVPFYKDTMNLEFDQTVRENGWSLGEHAFCYTTHLNKW